MKRCGEHADDDISKSEITNEIIGHILHAFILGNHVNDETIANDRNERDEAVQGREKYKHVDVCVVGVVRL